MKVIVRGHNVEMTDALKEYARKKFSKIEKYFDNIQIVQIELNYRATRSEAKRHVAQVTMWVSGSVIRGESASADMYASIDMVFDKLEKQVKKYKEKLKSRNRHKTPRSTLVADILSAEESTLPEINKYKKLEATEMSAQEAAIQMKMINHDFFIYKNPDTGKINVVYERHHGGFGNLEIS